MWVIFRFCRWYQEILGRFDGGTKFQKSQEKNEKLETLGFRPGSIIFQLCDPEQVTKDFLIPLLSYGVSIRI